MVTSVDKRSASLKLVYEETKEMWLVRVIDALDAPFRYYTAAVGLRHASQ